ncbi:MAG: ribosome maturation factor RimP [Deltaproteobacteria bacterium]|nr:ribosome maturation factor RimP [Deltaproteobacteria bacterium]
MNLAAFAAHIESLVAPIIKELGLEVVAVELIRQGGPLLLRLSVDYPAGGVTVEECARVSRAVTGVLDVEGNLPGAYRLEVSSPGVDRPLRTGADFARCVGKVVEIQTRDPLAGRSHFKGPLREATAERLLVEVDRVAREIPLSAVAKARLRYFEKP